MPVQETAKLLETGKAQWEDVVDFYSRHDCNSYRWPARYTRIVEPLRELPFAAE